MEPMCKSLNWAFNRFLYWASMRVPSIRHLGGDLGSLKNLPPLGFLVGTSFWKSLSLFFEGRGGYAVLQGPPSSFLQDEPDGQCTHRL